jgi:triacylglycerol lipase
MSVIVLAHGIFGFGDMLPRTLSFLPSVHYFNGVANHLRKLGHTVFEPQVNPIGSIQSRGDELAAEILKQTGPGDRLHILAHSMGGLDARCAITKRTDLVERVATLVTIGTPHRGSPVADAVVKHTGPLLESIPDQMRRRLESDTGAMHDLTTEVCTQFDVDTPDDPRVRYINIAGDALQDGEQLFLFQLTAAISDMTGEPNDGMVTRSSALRENHTHLPDWPVDHAGEIGWTKALLRPWQGKDAFAKHLERYDAIVAMLQD